MRHAKLHIVNPLGLHARAASKLVDVANNFASDVKVVNAGGIEADAKRIMNLLLLGAPVGSEVELFVQGEDENEALAALIELIDAGFHEMETS